MRVQCSWCRKIIRGDPLLPVLPGERLSHGICPRCLAEFMEPMMVESETMEKCDRHEDSSCIDE